MAHGQIYIRNMSGLLNAIRDQESGAVANYLDRNAMEMAPLIFGQSETPLEDLKATSEYLRHSDQAEQKILLNKMEQSINVSLSAQKTPKQTSPSWREIFKNLSWPAKIGYSAIPTALASFAVASFFNNAEPNDQTFTAPLDKKTQSAKTINIKQEPQQPAYTLSKEMALPMPPTKNEMAIAIEEIVKEALQEEITPKVTAENFDNSGVQGLRRDENGQIMYHDWSVSQDVYDANLLASQATGLPQSYLYAVQSVESSLDEKAINGIKACGLTQFVPDTLDYMAYEFAADIGFDGAENFIERYNTKGPKEKPVWAYRHNSPFSENTLMAMCWNAQFNVLLGSVNKIIDLGKMQKSLAKFAPEGMDYYPVTQLHGYVAVFAGGNGGAKLLKDLVANSGNSHAIKFFSSAAQKDSINAKLLYHSHTVIKDGKKVIEPNMENPRTVAEFYDFIEEKRNLSSDVLPDSRNWRSIVSNIGVKLTDLGISRQQITRVIAPQLPTERPQFRPAGLASKMLSATSPPLENKRTASSRIGNKPLDHS